MKSITVLMATFLLFSCNHSKKEKNTYNISEKQALVNTIRSKAAKQIKKELKLSPCGTAGQMMYKIEMVGLAFDYHHPITIDEGRKLLIAAGTILMDQVNAEARIFPYLATCPFQPKNIRIEIYLTQSDGREVPLGDLCIVNVRDGILEYEVHDPQTKRLTTIHRETYEEALAKIID